MMNIPAVYTGIFNALSVPATLIDRDGIILDINPAFIKYAMASIGRVITREDRIGRHICDFSPEPYRQYLWDFVEGVLASGHAHTRRLPESDSSDRTSYTELEGMTVRDEDGEVIGALLLRRLVSDPEWYKARHQVMMRLRDAIWGMQHSDDMDNVMKALRAGLEQLSIPFHAYGVNVIETDGEAVNVTCYTDFGVTSTDWRIPKQSPGVALIIKFWQENQLNYRQDLEQEDPFDERKSFARGFGVPIRSVVDVPFAYGTLAVNSTKPHAFDEVDLDILQDLAGTMEEGFRRKEDLKRLEEAVQDAKNMAVRAEAANVAKTQFLANVSHEIRTPLNGVLGMAGLLAETALKEEQKTYAEIILQSGEHLLSIINNILDLSKIEADHMTLDRADFELENVIETIVDTLTTSAQIKGLELLYVIDPAVRRRLLGDPVRLRQVILNLAGNAIKFTDEGQVVIETALIHETTDQLTLGVTVRDSGIGIDESKLGDLFQPFNQLEQSASRRFGGTGLGLVISKKLVELMGGEIGVRVNEDQGTTFWFTVVLDKADAPSNSGPQANDPARNGTESDPLTQQHVLVVNAYAAGQKALGSYLDSWGCGYATAASGAEALTRLRRTPPQAGDGFTAVVVDHQLADMSGEELVQTIRQDPKLASLGVVLTDRLIDSADSGADSPFSLVQGAETRNNVFRVLKPVKRAPFRKSLLDAVGQTAQQKDAVHPLAGAPGSGQTGEPPVVSGRHEDRRQNGAQNGPSPELKPDDSRGHILLVEDNAVNQRVGLTLLKKLSYQVDVVDNGEEAIEALRRTPYDLVLMDIQMPYMDGYEATRLIRDPESPVRDHAIPVIAMTANALPGDREACLEAGMNDFIAKPIRRAELLALLERWLSS